jgi:DNA-binding beta-propeller fold protein YncE
VGNGPSGIAFGADRVWVANQHDGTVSTIDPQSNEVGTLHLEFRPTAVAVVDHRAVWIALAACRAPVRGAVPEVASKASATNALTCPVGPDGSRRI